MNHLVDTAKNSLVVKCAEFAEALYPEFVVMENAREVIIGNNSHHYREFAKRLIGLGYEVDGRVHMLTAYGLPQLRERALVVASRIGAVRTLEDLWAGWEVDEAALTVRHAIGEGRFPPLKAGGADPHDPQHQCPGFGSDIVRRRMEAVPRDGGSWYDIAGHPHAAELLIGSMKDRLARNDLGSHGDVYGRLAWDRPAMTIKRECAHVGNGRYSHPEQARLLTVREMSMLQGFPRDYDFVASSLANRYRHIGDAVPPMISYQLSALIAWMKTGRRPVPEEWVLDGTSLRSQDIRAARVRARDASLFVATADTTLGYACGTHSSAPRVWRAARHSPRRSGG
jgi:DNA (cytosine-5)-methyltransferase 1